MTTPNKDQIDYWNGDMAGRWLEVERQLDEFLQSPLDELLKIANPRPGERVLDVGCGTGVSTFAVARQILSNGHVVGLDVSRSILDRARNYLEATDLSNVSFLEADAQTHKFETELFDLIISRFGVMFFDEPVAAFHNLANSLRPGGRVAVVTWSSMDDNNPWFSIPRDIAVAKLGPPKTAADPFAPSPFAFADVDRVVGLLEQAGLADVRGNRVELNLAFDDASGTASQIMVSIGAAARMLRENNAGPEVIEAVEREISAETTRFKDGTRLAIPATVNFFTALKV